MVIKTKDELDAKIASGWKISKKGKNYYVQTYDRDSKRVLSEKIANDLKKYAEELYHMQKLGMTPEVSSGNVPTETQTQASATRAEKAIVKATEQKIVQHVVKQIDKRTKYLLLWGEWVENNIVPLCAGDTFDEKAEEVVEELNKMLELYLRSDELIARLKKLESEVEVYRTIIEHLKHKLQATRELKDLIIQLSDKNPQLAAQLVDKFISLVSQPQLSNLEVRAL